MKTHPEWHIQKDVMPNERLQGVLGRRHEMGHSGSKTKSQKNHKEPGALKQWWLSQVDGATNQTKENACEIPPEELRVLG